MTGRIAILFATADAAEAESLQRGLSAFPEIDIAVRHAPSLPQAVSFLRDRPHDAMILDADLDGLDPRQALLALRAGRPDIPTILLGSDPAQLRELRYEPEVVDAIQRGPRSAELVARSARFAIERQRSRTTREQLENLVSANPDAMLVVDGSGVVRFVNDAALALFGRSHEDFVGDLLGFSIPEGEDSEIEILRTDGRRTAAMHVVRIEWNHAPAYLASLRDVTNAKRLNDQLRQAQKMEAVGRLAGGVAHDFNNMLTIILGYADELVDRQASEAAAADVREIIHAGERARDLTRQLLLYSRKSPTSPKPVSLTAIVGDLQRMLERTIGADIALSVNLVEDLWRVSIDPTLIEQTLLNLVVNARDAMPAGGQLIIETRNFQIDEALASTFVELGAGDYVLLAVSDTGCGMDPETRQRIFEPFYTTKASAGTGLGLATSYGVITQAGGHINVYSEPGVGTTFRIYLPRTLDFHEIQPKSPARQREDIAGSGTILVAEDEAAVRTLTCRILRDRGYTVLQAADGLQALALLRDHDGPLDLLLTDMVMPGMAGVELATQVLEAHPQARVLFMSGYTGDTVLRSTRVPRNAHYIGKPFSPDELAAMVASLLGHGTAES